MYSPMHRVNGRGGSGDEFVQVGWLPILGSCHGGTGAASLGATRSASPLSMQELALIDAWWRACNYLSVGMIYLRDNPLLREPLRIEHVKHRLLGHWEQVRALLGLDPSEPSDQARCAGCIFMAGPGHRAPGC